MSVSERGGDEREEGRGREGGEVAGGGSCDYLHEILTMAVEKIDKRNDEPFLFVYYCVCAKLLFIIKARRSGGAGVALTEQKKS